METVRFLETCYLFNTQKFYNLHDEEKLSKKQAKHLFDLGVVDILKTEKPKTEPVKKKAPKKKSTQKKDDK